MKMDTIENIGNSILSALPKGTVDNFSSGAARKKSSSSSTGSGAGSYSHNSSRSGLTGDIRRALFIQRQAGGGGKRRDGSCGSRGSSGVGGGGGSRDGSSARSHDESFEASVDRMMGDVHRGVCDAVTEIKRKATEVARLAKLKANENGINVMRNREFREKRRHTMYAYGYDENGSMIRNNKATAGTLDTNNGIKKTLTTTMKTKMNPNVNENTSNTSKTSNSNDHINNNYFPFKNSKNLTPATAIPKAFWTPQPPRRSSEPNRHRNHSNEKFNNNNNKSNHSPSRSRLPGGVGLVKQHTTTSSPSSSSTNTTTISSSSRSSNTAALNSLAPNLPRRRSSMSSDNPNDNNDKGSGKLGGGGNNDHGHNNRVPQPVV